jgi:hypothetical protein
MTGFRFIGDKFLNRIIITNNLIIINFRTLKQEIKMCYVSFRLKAVGL